MKKLITTIGRAEKISIPLADIFDLPAKVDTGADRSAIWATNVRENAGKLYFTLLGPSSSCYSGVELSTDDFKQIEIENSFGHKEKRYSIFLSIKVAGRNVKSNFTLANREMKKYPALIGRKMLHNRFLVDVTQGDPVSNEVQANVDNLE